MCQFGHWSHPQNVQQCFLYQKHSFGVGTDSNSCFHFFEVDFGAPKFSQQTDRCKDKSKFEKPKQRISDEFAKGLWLCFFVKEFPRQKSIRQESKPQSRVENNLIKNQLINNSFLAEEKKFTIAFHFLWELIVINFRKNFLNMMRYTFFQSIPEGSTTAGQKGMFTK